MERQNMAKTSTSNTSSWTGTQAYVLAIICLVIGVAIGYLVRGSATTSGTSTEAVAATVPAGMGGPVPNMGGAPPTPEQMKHMAEKQAEPLLAQLKSEPENADLLYKIGNVYYDAQQYPEAVKYYEDSLKVNPKAVDVRTDMATAYHYMGQTDRALEEFGMVLKTDSKHANALFNQGMVLWQDKMDLKGAIASWKQLLATNPDYAKKDQVQDLIAKAEKHMAMKPGTTTDKPAVLPQ